MIDFSLLDCALTLLVTLAILGSLNATYQRTLTVALPYQNNPQRDLAIRCVRTCVYVVLLLSTAHLAFQGMWVVVIALLFLLAMCLTGWGFVIEDRRRQLSMIGRVMRAVLAVNGGAVLALYGLVLTQWYALPTATTVVPLGWPSWTLTIFAIGMAASGIRDGIAAYRFRDTKTTVNPFLDGKHRRVLVTGGTGFIGEHLVNLLLDAGHTVCVLTRDPIKAAYLLDGRARCLRTTNALSHSETFDVVINLAGAPIAGGPWSSKRKAQLLASRVDTTRTLVTWLNQTKHKPELWIQASAIGFYGVRDASESLDENASAGHGFMSELCVRWEEAAQPVNALGVRQVIMRLGVVLGPGGALVPLLLPFRLGFGGRMGNGKQIMSWVHREDVIQIMAYAFNDTRWHGTYNVVAPDAISQGDFANTVGAILKRPVWLHIPAAPVRAVVGEMAQLFFDGQRVVPARLTQAGYSFRYPTLDSALRDLA